MESQDQKKILRPGGTSSSLVQHSAKSRTNAVRLCRTMSVRLEYLHGLRLTALLSG